jgi:DNA-3-methyladenine glycosylase II
VKSATSAHRHLVRVDARLALVIAAIGPAELPRRRGRYAVLVRAIIGQQVSTAAARTIYERVRKAAGGYVTPERLGTMTAADLRALGVSRQKASYVIDLTQKVLSGELRLARLDALDDEEVVRELTRVKGIGRWTAEMFLMFVLGRADVLPVGDLGVRAGFTRVYRMRTAPSESRMRAIAAKWRPYRSLGSWYMWQSLEIDPI